MPCAQYLHPYPQPHCICSCCLRIAIPHNCQRRHLVEEDPIAQLFLPLLCPERCDTRPDYSQLVSASRTLPSATNHRQQIIFLHVSVASAMRCTPDLTHMTTAHPFFVSRPRDGPSHRQSILSDPAPLQTYSFHSRPLSCSFALVAPSVPRSVTPFPERRISNVPGCRGVKVYRQGSEYCWVRAIYGFKSQLSDQAVTRASLQEVLI